MELSLYQAGSLFNAAERRHNVELESRLIGEAAKRDVKLTVTLPQRTALLRFISPEKGFDVAGIVEDCVKDAASHDFILCNTDGSDTDSGTAVEYGVALGQRFAHQAGFNVKAPHIITYRTDFRTAPEKEVGLNAMLKAAGTTHIYHPCFATELPEFDEFYKILTSRIVDVMMGMYKDK
jgi:nucleoside 2-deoxyribosyltransferase